MTLRWFDHLRPSATPHRGTFPRTCDGTGRGGRGWATRAGQLLRLLRLPHTSQRPGRSPGPPDLSVLSFPVPGPRFPVPCPTSAGAAAAPALPPISRSAPGTASSIPSRPRRRGAAPPPGGRSAWPSLAASGTSAVGFDPWPRRAGAPATRTDATIHTLHVKRNPEERHDQKDVTCSEANSLAPRTSAESPLEAP